MRFVVVSVIVTGCFSKPGPPTRVDDAANGTGDAPSDSPADPDDSLDDVSCHINDTFSDTGGPPCGTWGMPSSGALERNGGKLLSTPPATGGDAVCATVPLRSSGTFTIHLDQLGNGEDGHYVVFNAVWSGTEQMTMNIYRNSNVDMLGSTCDSPTPPTPYSANSHRYLRYSMQPQNNDVLLSLVSSADGVNFTNTIDTCMMTGVANAPVTITFGSAVDFAGATSPTSAWDSLVFQCD